VPTGAAHGRIANAEPIAMPAPSAGSDDTSTDPRAVIADIQRGVIMVDGIEHHVAAHHCQIVNALVEEKGLYRTGPQLNELSGCRGKKISRELSALEKQIPSLCKYLKHEGNKGYRIVQ
jgi:hypothetical protein